MTSLRSPQQLYLVNMLMWPGSMVSPGKDCSDGKATRLPTDEDASDFGRVRRALITLSAGNRTLLRSSDEQSLLRGMCQVIVEQGSYRYAGVWYALQDANKTLTQMAYALHAGQEAEYEYFDTLKLSWSDAKRGFAPAIAIQDGEPCIGRNLLTDPDHAAWRENAIRLGYGSVTAFPLCVESVIVGALSIAAKEPDAFDETEVNLLGELAEDLAYGIANLRMRIKQQEAEATIQRMAYYDALTELPNRTMLCEQLQTAIEGARHQHRPLALLLLSVRHFQEINDTLGYQQGDQLLQEVAQRLSAAISADELVARVGEAEFAILIPQGDANYATQTAHLLSTMLHDPIEASGLKLDAQASIGIALFPGHGSEPDPLLRHAQAAMSEAKHSGRDYAIFTVSLDQACARRLAMTGDLRWAIEHSELLLYCQPKVRMASAQLCGAEALVRWQHPLQGMVATAEFVKLAELTGLITPLTHWVLEAAFRASYTWHEAGLDLPLSVNLSAQDLRDPKLLEKIEGLFATWGAHPSWIQFELTESALMEEPSSALETLWRLKKLGVALFIDDFGIGYSSLSYLQNLPIDALKIDQSFVSQITESPGSEAIVHSTIALGHRLKLEVVAEGVESQEVWDRLEELGCDVIQGYCVATPMPVEKFKDWQDCSAWGIH
ncbi:MAG: GGDEF domain-containing protein [Pseudomonas sp.]|nr:GGDEF domain-containing protein [Pseudomonas sp.]